MTGTHASRYFREDSGPDFPKSMEEVLHQVGGSINAAIDDGFHHRMRVQINCKEFDLRTTPYSKSLVPYFINLVGNQLVDRGLRVSFVFNSVSDASEARRLLRDNLKDRAAINVLGLGDFSAEFDIMVLVCPSNEGNENLRRIEAVEKVIYGGPPRSMVSRTERTKFLQRPIVLFNPFLEAIHPTATENRKVVPMFMSDFQMIYFLEPQIMQLPQGDFSSEASLFKAHPSNWQLWVRGAQGATKRYRKVWEESRVPTANDRRVLQDVRERSRAPTGW